MQRDGKLVTDPAEIRTMAVEIVERFLDRRIPTLRILGIL